MPKITVLLPTRQSELYLCETVQSVLTQTFSDFELLVVDDASTDRTLEILASFRDGRIRVLAGPGKGLAEALNLGLRQAGGEYIARIDADDLMTPRRLEKQVAFMDVNQKAAVCGSWQQYFGQSTFLHAPPVSPEQCRANLLFRCDLCHSTLMLRKDVFLQNQLFYNSGYAAEDFELWTRVLDFGEIANLPEVLGYYREDGRSITSQKRERLIQQNGQIVAQTLKRNLQIRLTEDQQSYFGGWENPFYKRKNGIVRESREAAWKDLKDILWKIYEHNQQVGYYQEAALLRTLDAQWNVLRYNAPFSLSMRAVSPQDLFRKRSRCAVLCRKFRSFCRNYRGFRRKYIKICKMLFG